MKHEIQKLITELEARKKSHRSDFIIAETPLKGEVAIALEDECDFFINKLTLLLNDESKQPQPPDFANTMLGEVPHEVNAQSEDTTQAVEGATPVVRQNEQTKEVCPSCLSGEIWHNWEFSRCDECNHTW